MGKAKRVDHVVLVIGLDQSRERKKQDRVELGLPGKQEDLVSTVAKAAKNPVLLVLLCGSLVDVSFAKADAKNGLVILARVHMWLVQSRPPGPEACYTYYTSSDVIRRHQTSSDVIRRHQTSSDADFFLTTEK
ncbi:probable beta-D-xylosidase 7 [Tanacetum coccineum]